MNEYDFEKIDELKIKYICFDYFDTIVHRNISDEDVKRLWAKELSYRLLQQNVDILPNVLYEIRKKAERTVGNFYKFSNEPRYEWIINVMFSFFANDIEVTNAEFYSLAIESEVKVELDCQVLDLKTVEMIRTVKEKGYTVLLLTDFYLPQEEFERFLNKHDLSHLFDYIYVSSEYDVRKSNGSMYKLVKEQLFAQDSAIMIGDNENSDVVQAERNGLYSIHKLYQKVCEQNDYITIESKLKRIAKEKKEVYSNYAFVTYLFIEKLYRELHYRKIRKAYFLSREGDYLKYLFELYQKLNMKQNQTEIETRYLYVSRVALRDALKNGKENLQKYFESEGINCKEDEICIVDVGWKGSMQDIIRCLFPNVKIKGFYLGLTTKALCNDENQKYGMVFTPYPNKTIGYHTFLYDSFMQERLLCANHGSVMFYDEAGVPVLDEQSNAEKLSECIKEIRNDMNDTFLAIFKVLEKSCYSMSNFEYLCARLYLQEMLSVGKKHKMLRCKLEKNDTEVVISDNDTNQHSISKLKKIKKQIKEIIEDEGQPISYLQFILMYTKKIKLGWCEGFMKPVILGFQKVKLRKEYNKRGRL